MSGTEAPPTAQPPSGDGAALTPEELARREKLKRAGEAYFEKILAQSGPAALPARPQVPNRLPGPGGLPAAAYDPEFEQIGAVVEGARTYVLGIFYVISQAASLVFIKSSLEALRAPALLALAHLLTAFGGLLLLATQHALALRSPWSAASVLGSLPSAVLYGLQTLSLFSAALQSSVYLVLCWTAIVPHVLAAAQAAALGGSRPATPMAAGLGVGLLAVGIVLLRPWPGTLGLLFLLLWAAAQAATEAWTALVRDPPALLQASGGGGRHGQLAARLAEAQAAVEPATLALLQQALPAAPILVLGLISGEARELVDHELSVPAVTMMALSCLAWALGAAAPALLLDGLPRQARAALQAAGPIGAVVAEAAVRGLGGTAAFAAAVVAALVGLLLRLASAVSG